jgi:hypothetical protein
MEALAMPLMFLLGDAVVVGMARVCGIGVSPVRCIDRA